MINKRGHHCQHNQYYLLSNSNKKEGNVAPLKRVPNVQSGKVNTRHYGKITKS